jgi:hypothetical protein
VPRKQHMWRVGHLPSLQQANDTVCPWCSFPEVKVAVLAVLRGTTPTVMHASHCTTPNPISDQLLWHHQEQGPVLGNRCVKGGHYCLHCGHCRASRSNCGRRQTQSVATVRDSLSRRCLENRRAGGWLLELEPRVDRDTSDAR